MDRCPFHFLPTIFILCAVLGHGSLRSSIASPIPAPDITNCRPPSNFPDGEPIFNCCPPPSRHPALPFQPSHGSHAPLRVRRPTHALDPHYANKLSRGYKLMKALPPSDPRSFLQQANIHCAYCNAVYTHGNTSIPLQVHASWLFFPFHRWYLYFHERILASLLQDDTFALAFWNYDSKIESTIPAMFFEYLHLTDSKRETAHFPPAVVRLDRVSAWNCSPGEQIALNDRIMHHVILSGGKTASLFSGRPYRFGDQPMPGYGTAELFPHNMVHAFVGNHAEIGWKDMGSFYAAARDPIFYTHHANLDRLWDVWQGMEGHKEFDDPDYLDSEFVFYNERAELVKVRTRDCLSMERLGYTYESVQNSWMSFRSPPLSTPSSKSQALKNGRLCKLSDEELMAEPCSVLMDMERHHDQYTSLQTRNSMELILVVEGIRVHKSLLQDPTPVAGFHVFLNLPQANLSTTVNCAEYAGSFNFAAHMMGKPSIPATLRLGIGSTVEELHLHRKLNLIITIVPNGALGFISISGVKFEYEIIKGFRSLESS